MYVPSTEFADSGFVDAAESSVYYPGCNDVRAAGKAPLYRGQPGYRSGMDGDDDGIACEPMY
ncbi:excalibur calcium-binding domain-containing protein [Qipengyuania marisflavi]|uniref:Excalibur calcium-binding domain-containing protein n=1 Tax=Qipengyuania marisflavi TaxID=2486356 RepID=A0A5S3PBR6_9SPHN|nr:excalibur calcium-binding domain-containing protein [Qipengyuania marisflavi]